ncbi:alpha/beta-type small acid-soluble spore protein [Brevibacillus sp. B_LB10_24]|uniref:alpha/beta-type small acid-soluble spore protein n=1 Tax=Brevibacillus sp. B_LB10_24 TaxID=3380645 RepID=UPI0038BCAAA7
MSRNRRPLVPGSREALDLLKARLQNVNKPEQAKYKVADSLNIPLSHGYNGQLTSHDAGKIGGELGGSMVKELIRSAQIALTANDSAGENKQTT